MPKSSRPPKKAAPVKDTPQRIPNGITVMEVYRLTRKTGISPEAFERLSGESAHKLRRGRGGEGLVPTDKLDGFRRCDAVFQRAVALCGGNEEAAVKWLTADAPALKGQKPIEAAETEAGFKAVEKLFAQLEGSVAS